MTAPNANYYFLSVDAQGANDVSPYFYAPSLANAQTIAQSFSTMFGGVVFLQTSNATSYAQPTKYTPGSQAGGTVPCVNGITFP